VLCAALLAFQKKKTKTVKILTIGKKLLKTLKTLISLTFVRVP
jgi:hypothetical protein